MTVHAYPMHRTHGHGTCRRPFLHQSYFLHQSWILVLPLYEVHWVTYYVGLFRYYVRVDVILTRMCLCGCLSTSTTRWTARPRRGSGWCAWPRSSDASPTSSSPSSGTIIMLRHTCNIYVYSVHLVHTECPFHHFPWPRPIYACMAARSGRHIPFQCAHLSCLRLCPHRQSA